MRRSTREDPCRSPRVSTLLALLGIFLLIPSVAAQRRAPGPYETLARRFAKLQGFSGAVLVARGDEVLYRGGIGQANREWSQRNAPDTRFRIGSITKAFTAAVILQLDGEGKVDLEAPVTRYLPEFRKDTGDRITLHHLLTHTSGLSSGGARTDLATRVAAVERAIEECRGDLEFEPGEGFLYSNRGYRLLGAVIESVTGQRYEVAVQRRIFAPAGMTASGFDDHRALVPKRAAGYARLGGVILNAQFLDMRRPYAAGAAYSTVDDLHRWDRALHGNRILDASGRQKMFDRAVARPGGNHYGYGWVLREMEIGTRSLAVQGHSGAINGFCSMILRFPEDESCVIVLGNLFSRRVVRELAEGLASLLHGGVAPEVGPLPLARFWERIHAGDRIGAQIVWKELEGRPAAKDLRGEGLLKTARRLIECGQPQPAAAVLRFDAFRRPQDEAAPRLLAELGQAAAGGPRFTEQLELLPGPVVWSEGVHPLDVNRDGRPDLLFVNCNGWRRPGDMAAPSKEPLAPTLLINQGVAGGRPVFVDQTAELLPEDFRIHGKNAAVCDVDGDGNVDLVFAVAFGAQPRLLRFDPRTSRFVDETAQRLPELSLNSNGVGWGDVDDDGDFDLVFVDSGPNSDRRPGGKARLLFNDGAGNFAEIEGRLPATNKVGAQNAKVFDIDGDLDLDIVIDGKSPETQLYLNDGAGHFTPSDAIPRAATGGQPYEIEWADVDNDGDWDAIHMSWGGNRRQRYRNVFLENRLSPSGTLSFRVHENALDGRNNEDENEFAWLDADGDGDLDLLVATLISTPLEEKLFINTGPIGNGFLRQEAGAFSKFADGTLDMAVADFDGDGRYDVVTAQGESDRYEGFRNRYYANSGPADTTGPSILRHALKGRVVRAQIQDATLDDMTTFVKARVRYQIGEEVHVGEMDHCGGLIHRFELPKDHVPPGARLSYSIEGRDPAGNETRGEMTTATLR